MKHIPNVLFLQVMDFYIQSFKISEDILVEQNLSECVVVFGSFFLLNNSHVHTLCHSRMSCWQHKSNHNWALLYFDYYFCINHKNHNSLAPCTFANIKELFGTYIAS